MSAVAVRAGAFLHHLQLQSPDPEKLAAFYGDAMDMSVEKLPDGRWHCFGPQRHMLFTKGQAKGFDFAAFGCRDAEGLAELRERARSEGLNPADIASPLFADAFSVRDPDGNGVVFGLARDCADEGQGVRGPLQHVTLATFDVGAIENFYVEKLGFLVSDRVVNDNGGIATCFMRSNHEHHTLACFLSSRKGLDHHSYEAGEWDTIRDWADRFAAPPRPRQQPLHLHRGSRRQLDRSLRRARSDPRPAGETLAAWRAHAEPVGQRDPAELTCPTRSMLSSSAPARRA